MTALELDKEMMKLRIERDKELEEVREKDAILSRNMSNVQFSLDELRHKRIELEAKVRAIKDKRQDLLDARKDINTRYADRKLELIEQYSPSEKEAEEWKYAEPGEEGGMKNEE